MPFSNLKPISQRKPNLRFPTLPNQKQTKLNSPFPASNKIKSCKFWQNQPWEFEECTRQGQACTTTTLHRCWWTVPAAAPLYSFHTVPDPSVVQFVKPLPTLPTLAPSLPRLNRLLLPPTFLLHPLLRPLTTTHLLEPLPTRTGEKEWWFAGYLIDTRGTSSKVTLMTPSACVTFASTSLSFPKIPFSCSLVIFFSFFIT